MKRNKSRLESFLSGRAGQAGRQSLQPADPVDQRGGARQRGRNDPHGSDFRCRYFSLLTVMMMIMMMMIQSHVGYMQQWENDIRCSAYIKYEIKLQFSCSLHI